MRLIQKMKSALQHSSFFNTIIAIIIGIGCGIGTLVSLPLTIFVCIVIIFVINSNVASKPLLATYILIFTTVMTSAMERGRILPMLVPSEVVLILVFGLCVIYVISHYDDKPLSVAVFLGTLIMIVGTVIIPILSYRVRNLGLSPQIIFQWIAPIQYLLLFWIFATIPRNRAERLRILQVMFLSASVVAIIGLLQAARIPFILDFLLEWYPSKHTEEAVLSTGSGVGRITSVFSAWNVTGTFLMVNLLVLTALQNEKMPKFFQVNMVVSAILCLLALLSSGSYASIGGLLVGFIFIKIIDPRGLKQLIPLFGVLAIGVIILLPVLSQRFLFQFEDGSAGNGIVPRTLAWRFQTWTDIYIPLIEEDPIWGAIPSFENYSFAHVDSQYLELLISKGFVSLIALFCWLMFIMTWLIHIIRNESSLMRSLSLAIFTCFVVMIFMGITNPVFTYTGVMDYIWIYIGLIAGSRRKKIHISY